MTNKENLEKIQKIAEKYGYETQSRQCIEEMAELTQAINKLWRVKKGHSGPINEGGELDLEYHTDVAFQRHHVIEELADVQIMVWQMILLLDAEKDGEFDLDIIQKLDRQIGRIEMGV